MGTKPIDTKILRDLGLDKMVEIVWNEKKKLFLLKNGKKPKVEFGGTGLVAIYFDAKFVRPDHYLLRNDPYLNKGECQGCRIVPKVPEGVSHYNLGQTIKDEDMRRERITEYTTIAFFKRR